MRQRRDTYYLSVNEKQMEELQTIVKQKRQELAAEHEKTGSNKNAGRITRLKGLQRALEMSVYFHEKHNKKEHQRQAEEDAWWEAIK